MKHYKDAEGKVFAYEDDGSQDNLIGDKVKMTQAEIDAHLNPAPQLPSKQELLDSITVATQSGKVFDGNETARSDMLVALTVGEWINETQTYWKMANNDTLLVTKDELQEALTLAIQEKGRIVGAIE